MTSRLCIVAKRKTLMQASKLHGMCCPGRENEKLAAFKAFWSGDHALIGEPGARGWAHAVALAGGRLSHSMRG